MRMRMAMAGLALLAGSAAARPVFDSAYSDLTFEAEAGADATCMEYESDPETGSVSFGCRGYGGIKVFLAESDLRTYVGYGWNAKGEIAFSQTFPMFNTVGGKVEWRLKDGEPVATILRYKMSSDGRQGEVLVVTQLQEGNQCWIARVSASKNKNANELAREAADALAGTVNCTPETEPEDFGVLDEEDIQPR